MKLGVWRVLGFTAAWWNWSFVLADSVTAAVQPTSDTVLDTAKTLEFRELACPPKEGANLWLDVMNDRSLSRDHRLAALTYLVLRHGNGRTLVEIKKWGQMVGVKDPDWTRVARLGGYLPIRKLDLGAGVYALTFKLRQKVVVSISVQLRSDGATVRESAAVVFDGNDMRRLLRSCE